MIFFFNKENKESVQAIKEKLLHLSVISGLSANMEKIDMYFAGVYETLQRQICEIVGMNIGVLPSRYLDVPLSSKKLTFS